MDSKSVRNIVTAGEMVENLIISSQLYELLKNVCVHTDFPSFYCLSLSVKIQTGSKSKIYASKCKFLIALIILIEHIRRVLAGTSLRKSWDSRLHQCAFF